MKPKRPKTFASWKNEVRRKIYTARMRTIDAFPLKFQKELSETNKVIKSMGRTKIGQSEQGMIFLNNLIGKINQMSTRNYKPITVMAKKPIIAISPKEAERIRKQREFYREATKTRIRARILGELGLGLTAGKLEQIAERYGSQAIKAILTRLTKYEVNARTGRKRITQEAYEEMIIELKKLLVNKLASPDLGERLKALASFILQRMKYFYEKDSDIQGHLWHDVSDDWLLLPWGELAQEMASVSSKFNVMGDLQSLADKYKIPLNYVFNYLDRMQGRADIRGSWTKIS